MSIRLALSYEDDRECTVQKHCLGTTFELGGSSYPAVDINYGYCQFYTPLGDEGIRSLQGKVAKNCIESLERVVYIIENSRTIFDEVARVNAGIVLSNIVSWAKEHPEAKFFLLI